MCQMLIIKYICPHPRQMEQPAINLCERKQELLRITKKLSHCDKVAYYELLSNGVCPRCSVEIFKLEKKYQIVEKLMEEGYGDRIKPLPAITPYEFQLWRVWRDDRERFRKLGVWGGDANGELGQGTWSLEGWDVKNKPHWHPNIPGYHSDSARGGGFEWAFYWDPFLGDLSDVRFPDDDGVKRGLEKLLADGSVNVHYRHEGDDGEDVQLGAMAIGTVNRWRDSTIGQRKREEGEMIELCKVHYEGEEAGQRRPTTIYASTRSQAGAFNLAGKFVSAAKFGPKSTPTTLHPQDEGIKSSLIHLVQPDNKLSAPRSLQYQLRNIDRKTYLIEQHDELDGIPVCKTINKAEARAAEKARRKAKAKSPAQLTKYLELNWAIDQNDLQHRLGKLKQFLVDGRRVEVFLAKKKKRMRDATEVEGRSTLEKVRECVRGVEGAREMRAMDGKFLERATLFYEGKRVKPPAEKSKGKGDDENKRDQEGATQEQDERGLDEDETPRHTAFG